MSNALLVEDNLHKRERTSAFLAEAFPDVSLTVVSSFSSACRIIEHRHFSLAILDMSLPTFDKSPTESGGRFRTFGGREVARRIIKMGLETRIVFLTQYPNFRDELETHSLQSLSEELKKECGPSYAGLIHYDSSKLGWKNELASIVSSIA